MREKNQIDQYADLSEIITTKEVCQKCFGNDSHNIRRNLYNYIKRKKFPQPLIQNKNYFLFSNREVFRFVRYGILEERK